MKISYCVIALTRVLIFMYMDFCYNGVCEDNHKNRNVPMYHYNHLTLVEREKIMYFIVLLALIAMTLLV